MLPTLFNFPSLTTLKAFMVAAILLCDLSGGIASEEQVGNTIKPPVSLDSSLPGEIVAPAGWTALTMLREDKKAPFKTVMIRDGADTLEV